MQDITQHLSGNININLLLEMVVEGIHREIGMDRTLFCILSIDKKLLTEKLALGWEKPLNDQNKIKLDVSSLLANLFYKAITSDSGLWAKPNVNGDLYTPSVINRTGKTESFLLPIQSGNNTLGLIYTDRATHHKPLTNEDFNVAKLFSQQAIIGLALHKIKKI